MISNRHEDQEISRWKQDITALEVANCRAFVERDFAVLEQLWADDLLVNSPINRILSKQKVLELLSAKIIGHVLLECHIEAITKHGLIVVVMGSEQVQDAMDAPVYHRRYTNVWRENASTFQLVARHANIIANSIKPT